MDAGNWIAVNDTPVFVKGGQDGGQKEVRV